MPSEPLQPEPLFKEPNDSLVYRMNFGFQPEITGGGDSISTCSVTSETLTGSGSMTLGSTTIANPVVQVPISGGTLDSDYLVVFTATLASGRTRVLCGQMNVRHGGA